MDLMTHALIGAGAGAATQDPDRMRLGALAGAAAALLVDLDYFIGSAHDPLLQIEFHRHFSHSIIFIPIGAALAALLLWPLLGRRLRASSLYLATLAGYATHSVVDVCTSYGVHLFWPFSDQRIALDLISVIDPIFTLGIGIPVAVALWRRKRSALAWMLAAAVAYLGFSAWQQQQAGALAKHLAAERGHEPQGLLLRPSFGNTLLWRSTYRYQGHWHIDAIRPGVLAKSMTFPGASVPVFDQDRDLPGVSADSRIGRDIERLNRLSEGYLVWVSRTGESRGRLGDIRFSAVPTGDLPMWGLEFDPTRPEAAPEWFVERNLTPAMRQRFLDQLLARE
ncbi:MAG: metal-dependent hydrolase [Gammaproteobacteria bacterium]|nr:metal-dependent hydrolase [Gammaproteobacteria bacterium]